MTTERDKQAKTTSLLDTTRSSATAEKQRVSHAYLPTHIYS